VLWKRDMCVMEKRHVCYGKETCVLWKRDMCVMEKRHVCYGSDIAHMCATSLDIWGGFV